MTDKTAELQSAAESAGSELTRLLAVLAGRTKATDADKLALLRIATMCGVAGIYEHYKADVLAKFTIAQLQEIVNATEPFRGFAVEHIFHTALYG